MFLPLFREAKRRSNPAPSKLLDCFVALAMTAFPSVIVTRDADLAGDVAVACREFQAAAGSVLSDR
jgi:hypothetical protein